jgi:CRP/FNR family cyclic AMP-dependent transcriptional regulator
MKQPTNSAADFDLAKIFPDLAKRVLPAMQILLSNARIRKYAARASIFHIGDTSSSLYIILKGSVSISIQEEAKEVVVTYLNAGDFIGEMGLLSDSPIRTATASARLPCELAEISYERFHELSQTHPELALPIIAQLSNRLQKTTRKVSDLTFLDATGRIARCLHELAEQPDAVELSDGRQIKVTRQELGKLVGCSREMVGRVIKILEEQHFITTNGKLINVHHENML